MRGKFWFLASAILPLTAEAQTSLSEKAGTWTTGSSWVGGTMPGTLAAGTISFSGQTVVINGNIHTTNNVTANLLSSVTVNSGDTLVIVGNLTLNTGSSFTNNGVVIVFGNFTNSLSSSITSGSGKLVVTGNYSNALGLGNTFTGPSYIYGSATGFFPPPGVEDETDLQTDDAGLYNYTNAIYTVLPITLIYFTAHADDRRVRLNWATATEDNNDYFLIEKSKDGIHFSELTTVDGAGTTHQEKKYEEVDNHPYTGRSYYRLRQVDYDRKSKTFDVISVYIEESHDIQPYPNPTADFLYIDVEPAKYFVSLSDLNGVMIPSTFMMVENDTGRLTVDLTTLEAGVYTLHLVNKTNSSKVCHKVVVRK